jgi:predicted NBD/HSP70 family sugar kinase
VNVRIGIDLGGTKLEGVVLDAGGEIIAKHRRATPTSTCSSIVTAVADVVHTLEAEVGTQCTVGVGTPGAVSPSTGRMKNSNTTCLNGEPLAEQLEAALLRSVRIANDANCFALSEAIDGAGAGAPVVFGVIIGTGTGGGLVVRRRVLVGPNAIAGEWGHNPLPWATDADRPAADCYCGKAGCLETYLSGPGMARDHRAHTGREMTAQQIGEDAAKGDAKARETIRRYTRRLARGLAVVINTVDPDVIVLGGGLSNIEQLYPDVVAALSEWLFSDSVRTRVVPPVHGDASGVRGAAWLWEDDDDH